MNTDNKLNMDNVNEFPFLQNIDRAAKLFTLPEGYFDTFPNQLMCHIALQPLKNSANFSLPENYFSTLSDKIIGKIKADVSKNESEHVLSFASKENVYTVPENYFDTVSSNVFSQINTTTSAKVIPLNAKRNTWKMGVAAAVASAIMLSAGVIWENGNKSPKTHTQYAGVVQQETLSQLSNQEIAAYLDMPDGNDDDLANQQPQNENSQLKTIPPQEVENYLNNTPIY